MPREPQQPFDTKQLPAQPDHLAPDGSAIRELLALAGGSLAYCTLPAGAVSQPVAHRTVEEIWYCLAGAGQLWRRQGAEERVTELAPGVCVSIPVGTAFQFRAGAADLQILIATMPPWPGAHEATPAAGRWEPSPPDKMTR